MDISHDLRLVKKKTEIFDNSDIRRLLVDLYCEVFRFLCHALTWYTRTRGRLKAALNKSFYDSTVKGMVESIQKTVSRIREEATLITESRIEGIEQNVNRLLDLKIAGNENRHKDAEMMQQQFEKLGLAFSSLGSKSVQTLGAIEKEADHGKILLLWRTVIETEREREKKGEKERGGGKERKERRKKREKRKEEKEKREKKKRKKKGEQKR